MLDCHIHLETGPYTIAWVQEYVRAAQERGLSEIHLLEHCYLFPDFLPMYDPVRAQNGFIDAWLNRKGGKRNFEAYLRLADRARQAQWPVRIRFGLEICFFPGYESFVTGLTGSAGLDFLAGSVHFIDAFAFDHKPELWEGVNVNEAYRRFFERSIQLASCGVFNGLAHPDSIKLFGHRPSFSLEPYEERLADVLAQNGMYAEQNSGISRRSGARAGMEPTLLRAMLRKGVGIRTASDAHRPGDVGLGLRELEGSVASQRASLDA